MSLRKVAFTLVLTALAFVLALRALDALAHLGLVLLLSWLVAVAFSPAVDGFIRRGWPRAGATAVVYTALALISLAFFAALGGLLATQADDFLAYLPQAWESARSWILDNTSLAPSTLPASLSDLPLSPAVSTVSSGALSAFSGLATGLFDLVTVFVLAIYLSAGMPALMRRVSSLMPAPSQAVFVDVWSIATAKAGGFVLSKVALAFISSVFHIAAFMVIGVPYAPLMGVFAGVVSQFIPVVGTYVGVILPALLALSVDPLSALWVVLFATAYQQVENYVLTPRIAGHTMRINGGVALVGVLAGVALLGPVGAVVGMPLVAIVEALVDTYAHRYELHPDLDL